MRSIRRLFDEMAPVIWMELLTKKCQYINNYSDCLCPHRQLYSSNAVGMDIACEDTGNGGDIAV
jgi:hypothetical protein